MTLTHFGLWGGDLRMCRQNPESATGRPTSKIRVFWGILDAAAESRVRGTEYRILEDADFSRIHGFSKSNIRVSNFKIPPCSLSSRTRVNYPRVIRPPGRRISSRGVKVHSAYITKMVAGYFSADSPNPELHLSGGPCGKDIEELVAMALRDENQPGAEDTRTFQSIVGALLASSTRPRIRAQTLATPWECFVAL